MKQYNNYCVTIVTPVFNQASTLRETIESVLAQTYDNIQYIIVNDGSTDNTASVLQEYEGRVTIITQDNHGQSAALNLGWSEGKGDYLTYLSADDIMYPDCIGKLVSSIDDSAIVYYPDFDLIDADSRKIRTAKMSDYKEEELKFGLICQPGLVALFSAEVFRLTGGWDQSFRFIPDFEFWVRMAEFGQFRRIPEVLGGFRVHGNSESVREVSVQSSDEIVRFVDDYPYNRESSDFRKAYVQSRLMSSRSHFQSRRYWLGIQRFFQAIRSDPIRGLRPKSIQFVLSGAVRRTFYQFRNCFLKVFQ